MKQVRKKERKIGKKNLKRPKITVVGSNMIDLVTNINRMPRKGETIDAPSFDMGFGGKGANQAVAASLLGADVTMITRVGDDFLGPEVVRNFENYGINTSYIKPAKGISNGVAPIFVDPDGNNYILIVKGANLYVNRDDVLNAKDQIKKSDLVILQLEIPIETVYFTIELCETLNIPVILNPAPGVPLDFEIIKKVNFLIPNETELEIISGLPVGNMDDITEAALFLVRKGIKQIIVTMGGKGSILVNREKKIHISPKRVNPKDTTGAGDAFIGSFAYYYIAKGNIESAMKYANYYAALSTLRPGTQKSYLSKEEFEKTIE